MVRSLFLSAVAASSAVAADVVGELDFTCADNGTLWRPTSTYEVPCVLPFPDAIDVTDCHDLLSERRNC